MTLTRLSLSLRSLASLVSLRSVPGLALAATATVTVALVGSACSSTTARLADVGDAGGLEAGGEAAVADAASTVDPSGVPVPTACPATQYKTLIVVGDSISDVGAGGAPAEKPFYRTLLVNNDDALYPGWKGFDLASCWGLETANVVKASQGGAVATVPADNAPNDRGILLNQVTGLPANLPGPVLVIGTIGGNDVTGGLITVLTGTPAQQQKKIDDFIAGYGAALANLTRPDRFGPGVKATVLMTNIYDPSGGTGHFYYTPNAGSCPGALGLWPDGRETASSLAQWNDAMAKETTRYSGAELLELREPFTAHAVDKPAEANWLYQDCIHPNAQGHHAIRGVFWAGIVRRQ